MRKTSIASLEASLFSSATADIDSDRPAPAKQHAIHALIDLAFHGQTGVARWAQTFLKERFNVDAAGNDDAASTATARILR